MDDTPPLPYWTRLAGRAGTWAFLVGMVPLVGIGVAASLGLTRWLPEAASGPLSLITLVAAVVFAFGLAAAYLPRPGQPERVLLRSPVTGRWSALNGPGTKVPSHGLHAFAQTYAIDLVHEPEPGARPSFGGRRGMRDPRDFPAFGRPVLAPADGVVVTVYDGRRDHRSRSNWLAFVYLLVEGLVFQLRGTTGLLGNHVVLTLDDGNSVALAHLQRGSPRVREGERVRAGDVLAAVGNSGNSSEPHLHLQVMDRAAPTRAIGLPFAFTDVVVSDDLHAPDVRPEPSVPPDAVIFHAGVSATASPDRMPRTGCSGPNASG